MDWWREDGWSRSKKPEDWNEEEPQTIVDLNDKKPQGWLDNGPEKVVDPEAKKPEDWNDEEDGKWEAPTISNPECQKIGCGEWKARQIPNPKYKGKWVRPKVKNPLYIGKWEPKKISNPNYFVDNNPHNFPKISAIGLELWSMTKNVLFDNFIITHDEKVASDYAKETFTLKNKREKNKATTKTNCKWRIFNSTSNGFHKQISCTNIYNFSFTFNFNTNFILCRLFNGKWSKERKERKERN